MTKKGESMTAAELMARLQADPAWVRQHEDREAHFKALDARFRTEEEPLISDLAVAGHKVSSVWDLVNTKANYPTALPVLCEHLLRSYHPRILEGIVRALTVKESSGDAARVLLDELKRRADEEPNELRWALANALTVAADASMTDELRALLSDARYADVQERLKVAMKNLHAK